jgi:hypothetical protein
MYAHLYAKYPLPIDFLLARHASDASSKSISTIL